MRGLHSPAPLQCVVDPQQVCSPSNAPRHHPHLHEENAGPWTPTERGSGPPPLSSPEGGPPMAPAALLTSLEAPASQGSRRHSANFDCDSLTGDVPGSGSLNPPAAPQGRPGPPMREGRRKVPCSSAASLRG
ncbi:hypothetical protein NDU88_005129 [Pleurodeles waltl]|uniref:Uncharacterized protein n=1 Tax=Pleurodeles waltl TaxID=8319 RepID=A0AAV7TTG2_PLEWA|nr:hypothetical protein NDU88_005129 [Pleurodeles waltl]